LFIVVLFAHSALSARGQETAPVSRAEFQKAVEELKQQIQSLKAAAVPAPPNAPSATGGMSGSAAAAMPNPDTDLAGRVAALEKQVADLQQFRKEQINITNNHSTMLRDIATGRSTPDGGQRFVPNVQAIRDDNDSRRELVDTVVQGITRNTGELRIRNDMNTGQSLVINGVDTIYVQPHATRTVTVPSGTATTELAGEGMKSWMLGAPNYFQDIVIAPAVQTNAANVGGPWQYMAR
jgi:polyhydroxyalkanoate synthesis regulator phasin